jgi:hypothetical protein
MNSRLERHEVGLRRLPMPVSEFARGRESCSSGTLRVFVAAVSTTRDTGSNLGYDYYPFVCRIVPPGRGFVKAICGMLKGQRDLIARTPGEAD